MVDVDWLTLIFGIATALISGGLAIGSTRQQLNGMRRDIDRLYAQIARLEERIDRRINGNSHHKNDQP